MGRKEEVCSLEYFKSTWRASAFIAVILYLQQKLPLDNPVLRRLSALDPLAHGHSATLKALKQLPPLLPNRLNQEETDSYEDEEHRYLKRTIT